MSEDEHHIPRIVLTPVQMIAQMKAQFPMWKIRLCPSNGKVTATRKTIKGQLRIKHRDLMAVIRAIVKHERMPGGGS